MLGIVRQGIVVCLVIILSVSAFWPSLVAAAPNTQINYQGHLTDSSGVPVADGSYNIEFKLHTSLTTTGGGQGTCSGSCVFMETLTGTDRVTVTNGLFSVMIGSTTPLTGVNFNQSLYLSVNIGGSDSSPTWDGEMSPRRPLGTVPAAFEATRLGGLNSAQFLRSDATNSTSTASTFVTFNQSGAGKAFDIQISGATRLNVDGTGNVGIGTSTPYATLSVVGDVVAKNFVATSSAATSTFAGGVGVGTSTPAGRLGVNGSVFLAGLSSSAASDVALCLSTGKEVRVTSGPDCTLSSARFKQNIVDLATGLSEVLRLRPVSFQYTGVEGNHVGLIAEEVQGVEPRLVFYDNDGVTPRGVRYNELTAVLIKAIQEQQARLDALTGNLAIAGLSTGQKLSINAAGRVEIKELATEKLCLGGTCITETDLRKLLNLDPNPPVDNSGGGEVSAVPNPITTVSEEPTQLEPETKSAASEVLESKVVALPTPEETLQKTPAE